MEAIYSEKEILGDALTAEKTSTCNYNTYSNECVHEQGGWTFQYDVELERPVELIPNQTYSMEIFVDESVMEVYVNDEVAMSVRAYDLHDRKFGLAVSDGTVCFENIQLTTVGE